MADKSQNITEQLIEEEEDYSNILKSYNLTYTIDDYYLQVGETKTVQGWIIHLSVVKPQIIELLQMLIPELIKEVISFKIPINKDAHRNILEASFGYSKLGKVICIYPESDVKALYLVQKIIPLTKSFKGPVIPTDFALDNIIFTRYGGFNPVKKLDANGQTCNFIYDNNNQLIPDDNHIPFLYPQGRKWPFSEISAPIATKQKAILNRLYKPLKVIKADPKGNVIKGIYMKSFVKVSNCLIKQGRKNMNCDDSGRDISDRHAWEKEVYQLLAKEVNVPRVYDLFKQDGDSYLVIEFIEGRSLNSLITQVYENYTWHSLPNSSRILLIDYLLSVIIVTCKLHSNGIIHRDLTPANFLVDAKNKLYLIDMELSYSQQLHRPNPPFKQGTPGYMSTEQMVVKLPTSQEDIYALGAFMIQVFTNIHPNKFDPKNKQKLQDDLYFFIQENKIVDIIIECLSEIPANRPTLDKIQSVVLQYQYKLSLLGKNHHISNTLEKITTSQLKYCINAGIQGLLNPMMYNQRGLWHSKPNNEDYAEGYAQIERTFYCGFHTGLSGILYLLSRAEKEGYNIENCMPGYWNSIDYIKDNYLNYLPDVQPGLYNGAAGIALMIYNGIESNILENNEEYANIIRQCLSIPAQGLDVSTGASGQGIAILQCYPFLEKINAETSLDNIIGLITKAQERDGSWSIPDKKDFKFTGYSKGVAGIAYFLLIYASLYKDQYVLNAAIKALDWLQKNIIKKKEGVNWFTNNKSKSISRSLDDGNAGIALTFIKAYEVTKNPFYKEIAIKILNNLPIYTVNLNFTQSNGLIGLGEVYLIAHQVFQSKEWLDRAEWIIHILLHSYQSEPDGSLYWLEGAEAFPSADFMVGNSGIINFLLNYLSGTNRSHPFLAK